MTSPRQTFAERDELRTRVLAVLHVEHGQSCAELATVVGSGEHAVAYAVRSLVVSGWAELQIDRITSARRWLLATRPRIQPPTSFMISGPGERRDDCTRDAACLAGFSRTRKATACHCPPKCAHYKAFDIHADRLRQATRRQYPADPGFEKRVDKQVERLEGWANMRKFQLTPRGVAGNLPPSATWCIHWEHVAQAVAELDSRGMPDHVREAHVRFKRECAKALADYFTKGVASNPRDVDPVLAELLRTLVGKDGEKDQRIKSLETAKQVVESTVEEMIEQTDAAKKVAEEARATAAEARKIAEEARAEVRTRPARARAPSVTKRRRPEGLLRLPAGWISCGDLAARSSLPSRGSGGELVQRLAFSLFTQAGTLDPSMMRKVRIDHGEAWGLAPHAVERLRAPLHEARVCMEKEGYRLANEVMVRRTDFHRIAFSSSKVAAMMATHARNCVSPQTTLHVVEGGKRA